MSFTIKKKWIIPLFLLHEFILIGLTTWDVIPIFIFHGYDIIIICLFFRFVDFQKIGKNNLLKILIAIIIFSLFTIFIFNTPIEAFIMGFRMLIIPLLLVNIFMNLNIPIYKYKKLLKFLIYISIFQVIISLCQFIYFGGAGDWACGSLGKGGTNQLMLFQITIIVIILDKSFSTNSFNLTKIILVLFLTIPILVGSSKMGLIIVPIVFLIIFFKYQIKSGFKFQAIGAVCLLIFIGFYMFQVLISERDLQIMSSQEEIETYNNIGIIDEGRSMSRGSIIPLTLYFLNKTGNIITGVGMGNLYHSESVSGNRINSANQHMATRIGFVKVFGELGIIGLVAFLMFYINILKIARLKVTFQNNEASFFSLSLILIMMLLANSLYSGLFFKGAGNIVLLIVFGYLITIKKKYEQIKRITN